MTDMDDVWAALGGDPALLPSVSTVVRGGVLDARLPVRELARTCVGVCALAAAELGARRAGLAEVPRVRVDEGAVGTAFVSERHLLVDGRAPVSFAPLSRFWRTADGWVRTHANYPHHRERLLSVLGMPGAEVPEVAAEPGQLTPIDTLWYELQLGARRLWALPFGEGAVCLAPGTVILENPPSLAGARGRPARVVSGELPLFLLAEEAALLRTLDAPRRLDEAFFGSPEVAAVDDARGFLARCMRRGVVVSSG